jgi:hypothetical protein
MQFATVEKLLVSNMVRILFRAGERASRRDEHGLNGPPDHGEVRGHEIPHRNTVNRLDTIHVIE